VYTINTITLRRVVVMAIRTSSRNRYLKKFKESGLKRLEPPTKDTVKSLAGELNISRSAISARTVRFPIFYWGLERWVRDYPLIFFQV
jgi:hypothetical protein